MGAGWQERRWGRGGRGFNIGRGGGMRRGRGRPSGGGGSPASPQPAFGNVIYLPDHENAANASTAITDLATGGLSNPHVLTYNGNAQNSTADSKFGSGSSMLFDGTNDWVTRTPDVDFRPTAAGPNDTGEFCFESHVKFVAGATPQVTYSRYNASTSRRVWFTGINDDETAMFFGYEVGASSTTFIELASGVLTAGVWYHIAHTRENGFSATPGEEDIVRMFVDGVMVDFVQVDDEQGFNDDGAAPGPMFGDRLSGAGDFNGRLDNIRITHNEPVYTANFTPPTARHPTS